MGGKSGSQSSLPADHPHLKNPITQWFEDTGKYPSNALQWWVFKRPVVLGDTQTPPRDYLEVFDTALRFQMAGGSTPAPKGHYILSAFDQDRTLASGVSGLAHVASQRQYPSVCSFFAGRVFYAGVAAASFSTKIYFSQIIERLEQVGQCFQVEDPTDENTPDLLSNDGGVIIIPEIAQIVNLFPKGDSLFVFATNGVWQITGSQGVGFKANDYTVNKLTDTPALSALSFVSVDGSPIWWNHSGIWTIGSNQVGAAQVQSLTDQTIKSFYTDIPDVCKRYAKGAYNPQTKIVQWVYRSTAPEVGSTRDCYVYDRILNLNVLTGAFYPWSWTNVDDEEDEEKASIRGIFTLEGYASQEVPVDVVVSGDPVVVSDDPVVTSIVEFVAVDTALKYTTETA